MTLLILLERMWARQHEFSVKVVHPYRAQRVRSIIRLCFTLGCNDSYITALYGKCIYHSNLNGQSEILLPKFKILPDSGVYTASYIVHYQVLLSRAARV